MGTRGPKKGSVYAKTEAKRRGRARAIALAEVTAERTMLELARIAFTDRRGCIQTPIEDWTLDQGALLEGFEVIVKNAEAGDGHTDRIHKLRLATKRDALAILAKHFGLVTDKVDVTHHLSLEDLVAASNRREDPPIGAKTRAVNTRDKR